LENVKRCGYCGSGIVANLVDWGDGFYVCKGCAKEIEVAEIKATREAEEASEEWILKHG
jgi:DNA-directed RNA polymerase subunit RPC12/RpoP